MGKRSKNKKIPLITREEVKWLLKRVLIIIGMFIFIMILPQKHKKDYHPMWEFFLEDPGFFIGSTFFAGIVLFLQYISKDKGWK